VPGNPGRNYYLTARYPTGEAALALIKSAPDLVELGHDLVSRGNWQEALERFNEAARKFHQAGDAGNAAVALTYAAVATAALRPQEPGAYRAIAQAARALGGVGLKLGLREAPSSDVAMEADLLAREIEVAAGRPANPEGFREKAQALQSLSMEFRNLVGERVMSLPELYRQGVVRGSHRALPLAARAEEAMGEALISTDPKAAAERYQSARLYWAQAGRTAEADSAAARVGAYSRSAKCWLCGREVSGEGYHFYSMPSELTDVVRRGGGDSVLPSFNPTATAIYACRGCHNAVYRLADQIAYRRAKELETIIEYKLEQLRREIASMQAHIPH